MQPTRKVNRFASKRAEHHLAQHRAHLSCLQINAGRKCTQTCRHGHEEAAPWRTEMMTEPVAGRVGEWIAEHRPETAEGLAVQTGDHCLARTAGSGSSCGGALKPDI
ncbi:MAG: DUF3641 domain-containing protein, partial [Verrucomicrobia bacterium]|nr:DUF3641 domain-containing protein [Verrucomicrobiota bacterium]